MSKDDQRKKTEEQPIRPEQTNAYQAGYMAGYLLDNPDASPGRAGYLQGYTAQRERATDK